MAALRKHCGVLLVILMLPALGFAKAATKDNAGSQLYLTPSDAVPVTKVEIARQDTSAPVTVSADEMGADHDHGVVVARGHVEVLQGESILTADQLTYYQKLDMVVAEGNVSMLQPSGDVYFAQKAELKNKMKQGVIHEFQVRFADSSVLVASNAVKVNSEVTKLNKAAYTPCHICADAAPFWQMNASDATVDNVEERVTYHGATMEMSGVPVFYTPYLSHPTPNASAKSGFLAPSYSTNRYFGSEIKTPFYWRIDDDKDVVLTPWFTTSEGPLLQWDYRQLTDHGSYHIQGSATDPHRQDSLGNEVSGHEFRGHIFAQGDEEIADDTHIGFDIRRTSDDTYLRRYDFGDQEALYSRAYLERAQGRTFGLLEGLSIQDLTTGSSGKTTPLVLPILQGYYETPAYESGLKLHVAGDAQLLTREVGADQRRVSISPGATLPFVTDSGQVFTATVNLRQDVYSSNHVPLSGGGTVGGTTSRTLPQAALEWDYPLINTFERGAWVVEPVVLGLLQTNGGNPAAISNEDSSLLELTDTNLFSIDRMPGLDLYDSGSRIAYGIRSHYYDSSGVGFEGLLGQNYTFNDDSPFPNSTSPGEQFSDYIGRIGVNYQPYSLNYRYAIDNQTGTFNRNEIDYGYARPWLNFMAGYASIKNNTYLPDSREVILSAALPLDDNWSIYANGRRDLELDHMVTADGGIIYKNECFNLMFDTLRIYTRDRDIEPSTEFTFRVAFKNLGEFGGK